LQDKIQQRNKLKDFKRRDPTRPDQIRGQLCVCIRA